MKNLSEFLANINEDDTDSVYVVKDAQGEILSVSDTEKAAKEEAKKWNSECKKNGATVSKEPRKDYVK